MNYDFRQVVHLHLKCLDAFFKMSCCAGSVCVKDLFWPPSSMFAALSEIGQVWIYFMLASKNTDRGNIVFTVKEIPLWMLIPHLLYLTIS